MGVGVQGPRTVNPQELTSEEISFPVSNSPVAAAQAADALGYSAEDIQQRPDAEFEVVREDSSDAEFSLIDNAAITYSLHSLDGADQSLIEEAAGIVSSAHGAPEQSMSIDETIWERVNSPEAFQEPEEEPEEQPAVEAEPQDANHTLFLLDTSLAMVNDYPHAAEMIAEQAGQQAQNGGTVALWNYSSPLSEGVTNGWRRNIAFTPDYARVQDSVTRFGIGGQPETRSALVAAVEYAKQYAEETGELVEVKLFTSGTAEHDMNDEDFQAFLDSVNPEKVTISVEHFGGGEMDPLLPGA